MQPLNFVKGLVGGGTEGNGVWPMQHHLKSRRHGVAGGDDSVLLGHR